MRALLLVAVAACGSSSDAPTGRSAPRPPQPQPPPDAAAAVGPDAALPAHRRFAALADALTAAIGDDARVIGLGELHARTDRPVARTALAQLTATLPALGDQISDLVLETWIVDPKCGRTAVETTRKLETEVRRPATTKSEIAQLVDAAKAAGIRPHAMTLGCADYETLAPGGGAPDPVAMLTLTTRELTRVTTSAIAYRDRHPGGRRWIAVYGGALHNDRFPDDSVAEWSYVPAVDAAARGRYVEIDLIVPALAEADATSRRQPWFPLVGAAGDEVILWARGARSFVVILPRAAR